MDASQKYGKIPNVHFILLLKMDFELGFRKVPSRKVSPSPVIFLIHHRQQLIPELRFGEWAIRPDVFAGLPQSNNPLGYIRETAVRVSLFIGIFGIF
jgi:hypothetical protein